MLIKNNQHYIYVSAIICFTALLAHGISLFNNGIFWDGSLIYLAQIFPQTTILKDFFFSQHLYFNYYLIDFLNQFDGTLIFRLLSFFSLCLSPIIIYLILDHIHLFSRYYNILITLFITTFPGISFGFNAIMVTHAITLLCFFLGYYLGSISVTSHTYKRYSYTLLSLLFFTISFFYPSNLPFYSTFVIIHYLLYSQYTFNISSIWQYIRKNSHFLLLPFLFWYLQNLLYSNNAAYDSYNKIELLTIAHYLLGLKKFVIANFFNLSTVIALTGSIFSLFYLFIKGQLLISIINNKKYLYLLLFGLVAWFFGTVAFLAVGKVPGIASLPIQLYDSRLITLTAPATAIILCTLILFFFTKKDTLSKTGNIILFTTLISNISINITHYLQWQGKIAVHNSIVQHLHTQPTIQNYSVYRIKNQFPVGYLNPLYSYEVSAMIAQAYPQTLKYATDLPACYFIAVILNPNLSKLLGYSDISLKDTQWGILTLKPSQVFSHTSLTQLGIYALFYRILYPDHYKTFIATLASVSIKEDKQPTKCIIQPKENVPLYGNFLKYQLPNPKEDK